MSDFNWYLNKTGMRGLTGAKGDTGFSPVITVGENTLNNYTLIITNENESFETPNLLGGARQIIDEGGTYIRYNQETGELSAADPDMATSEERGVVRLSTTEDLENPEVEGAIAITPSTLKDGLPILLTSPDNSVSIIQNPDTDKTELTVDTSIIESDIDSLKDTVNILGQNQRQLFADDQTEREVRMAADTQLQGAINAERAERETQDASLQTQLGSKLTVDNIKEGENITITKDGNNVTISSTGGGVVPENVMTTDTSQSVTASKIFENGTLKIGKDGEGFTTLAKFNKDMHWTSEDKSSGFTDAIEFGANTIGTFYKPYITGSIEEGLETFYSPSLSEHDVDNQTIKVVDGKLHADFSEIGDEVNSLANRVSTAESSIETINGEITDITGDLDGKQAKLNQGANITLTPEEDGTVTISATGGSEVEVDNTTIEINDEGKLQTTVDINALESKVEQLELYKSPNAVINGDLDINNGQVTGFSATNYLEFPLEFETKGRTWVFNGSFHTGNNVTTQQNFVDSLASVAIAVRSGKVVFALSSNGTTFNLGEVTGVTTIEPDSTYYFRLSFSGTQYTLELSMDKMDYTQEGVITSSEPIASTKMTISSAGHPFGDMINLNDWNLTLGGVLVWQGMDSVGISSRLSVDFDNLSDTGNKALNDRIEAATAEKQDKLTAIAPVNITNEEYTLGKYTGTITNGIYENNTKKINPTNYSEGWGFSLSGVTGVDYTKFDSIFSSGQISYLEIPADFSKANGYIDIVSSGEMTHGFYFIGITSKDGFKPLYEINNPTYHGYYNDGFLRQFTGEPFKLGNDDVMCLKQVGGTSTSTLTRTYGDSESSIQLNITSSNLISATKRGSTTYSTYSSPLSDRIRECNAIRVLRSGGNTALPVASTRVIIDGVEQSWRMTDAPKVIKKTTIDVDTLDNRVTEIESMLIPATTEHVGLVKPDNTTVTIDADGTLHASGGGSEGLDTSLTNITPAGEAKIKEIVGITIRRVTQAEYDELPETEENIMYVIVG